MEITKYYINSYPINTQHIFVNSTRQLPNVSYFETKCAVPKITHVLLSSAVNVDI